MECERRQDKGEVSRSQRRTRKRTAAPNSKLLRSAWDKYNQKHRSTVKQLPTFKQPGKPWKGKCHVYYLKLLFANILAITKNVF